MSFQTIKSLEKNDQQLQFVRSSSFATRGAVSRVFLVQLLRDVWTDEETTCTDKEEAIRLLQGCREVYGVADKRRNDRR